MFKLLKIKAPDYVIISSQTRSGAFYYDRHEKNSTLKDSFI